MLVKLFISALMISVTLFFTLLYHSDYSAQRESQIQTLTRLTKLPGLALSTGYLESRIIYYSDDSNQLYPEMKNYSKMDYIYAK